MAGGAFASGYSFAIPVPRKSSRLGSTKIAISRLVSTVVMEDSVSIPSTRCKTDSFFLQDIHLSNVMNILQAVPGRLACH